MFLTVGGEQASEVDAAKWADRRPLGSETMPRANRRARHDLTTPLRVERHVLGCTLVASRDHPALTPDFATVGPLERAKRWYCDVLEAEVLGEYGGTSCVLRFLDAWLLLVTGGPPTVDKPTVTFASPGDPERVAAELIIGVPDCHAAHAVLEGRGARFLSPPVEYPWEIRAFFRDPDGHLFEISQQRPSP